MLYIVSTPIGNLDDLSLRQARTLASSDIILAEDTRSAQILIQGITERFTVHFKTPQKLISYYKEKEFEKLPEIIKLIKEGKIVSLVSESGTPLISDPGYLLVNACIREQLPFTVIPGPSVVLTSLIYSGINATQKNGGFMFIGFMPKKDSEIVRTINRLKQIKELLPEVAIVFFESPNRINTTLNSFDKLNWKGNIVICRELTKKFEEVIRGKASDLKNNGYKGELTVILK